MPAFEFFRKNFRKIFKILIDVIDIKCFIACCVCSYNSTPMRPRGRGGDGGRYPRRGNYQHRGRGYQGDRGGYQSYWDNRGGYQSVDRRDRRDSRERSSGLGPKRKMHDEEQLKKFLGAEYQVRKGILILIFLIKT